MISQESIRERGKFSGYQPTHAKCARPSNSSFLWQSAYSLYLCFTASIRSGWNDVIFGTIFSIAPLFLRKICRKTWSPAPPEPPIEPLATLSRSMGEREHLLGVAVYDKTRPGDRDHPRPFPSVHFSAGSCCPRLGNK